MLVESPVEDPDQEDSDQSDDHSPQKDLTLINLSGCVSIIVLLLYEVRFEGEQEEPNNNTDDQENHNDVADCFRRK